MAAVDLELDIAKKGDGPARLPCAWFTFKMALKFKPVVLVSKRVTRLLRVFQPF